MIEVRNLTRKYGALTAVNSISFSIPKGQIVGLLGHNGAGKTTTLKMITGYLEPTSGSVHIDGQPLEANRIEIQKKIGYLSEQSPLYVEMTVWQYLEYVAKLRGIPDSERMNAISEAIQATDLAEKATCVIDTLSKGYRQRVGVAQAIIHKPEILILDEPTNGLDPTQIQAMRNLIINLANHATVILSTHIMQEVEAICDRAIIILNGQIAVDSNLKELTEANNISLGVTKSLPEVKGILAGVKEINHISQIPTNGQINHFRLESDHKLHDVTPVIARKVLEQGWDLHELQQETRDLETIFNDVNRGHNKGELHA